MAGFRGPLFLLGVGASTGVTAGFRNPLPIPPVSGTDTVTQGGFRNPLPIPPIAGTEQITQAGFIGPIPVINLGARASVSQGGPSDGAVRHPLQDDEEVIMLVARAFLTLVS